MTKVPREVFDHSTKPPDQRLLAFQEVTASIYDARPLGDPEAFNVRSIGHNVGPLIFNQVEFTAMRFHRTQRHTTGPGADFLVLEEMLAGEQHVAMPNCHLHMRPGHVYLRDWSQPFDAKTTPMLLNSVLVPRHLLEAQHDLDEDHPVVSWPISTPGGRVTSSLWSQLLFEFETAPVEEAERLCSGFLSFLSAMIATGKRETVNRSRADMEDYLNACLLEQVGVDDLCRQFQVSRTTVYRLFHSTGGVRQYIVNARLDHCHMELWSSDPSQVRVRDVARAWGFSEATSFARSFRARFGVPPSTVLGRGWTSKTDQRRARQDLSHIFQEAYAKWFNQAAGAPNTRSGASDR